MSEESKDKNIEEKLNILDSIALSLILIFFVCLLTFVTSNSNCDKEQIMIDNFFNDVQQIVIEKEENYKEENVTNKNDNYLAILEIPKINILKGFFDKNSKYNDVNQNIEILEPSIMPEDGNDSRIILAAHSGNGSKSFFKNLYKLEHSDKAYIYYKGLKYVYEIVKIEYQDKDGKIRLSELEQDSYLILTTCDQKDKTKQIVITAKLINTENY